MNFACRKKRERSSNLMKKNRIFRIFYLVESNQPISLSFVCCQKIYHLSFRTADYIIFQFCLNSYCIFLTTIIIIKIIKYESKLSNQSSKQKSASKLILSSISRISLTPPFLKKDSYYRPGERFSSSRRNVFTHRLNSLKIKIKWLR